MKESKTWKTVKTPGGCTWESLAWFTAENIWVTDHGEWFIKFTLDHAWEYPCTTLLVARVRALFTLNKIFFDFKQSLFTCHIKWKVSKVFVPCFENWLYTFKYCYLIEDFVKSFWWFLLYTNVSGLNAKMHDKTAKLFILPLNIVMNVVQSSSWKPLSLIIMDFLEYSLIKQIN